VASGILIGREPGPRASSTDQRYRRADNDAHAKETLLKVEIWSDVVCPWCYIGKRRFETALSRFDGAADVDVTWRAFQLNPDQPRGVRTTHDEYLASRIGAPIEQVRVMNARVTALAAAEGLDYHFERYQVINTLDAHRVAHLGRTLGHGDAIHERLLRAQLVEGEVLDDPDTLARLGEEVGVPGGEIRDVLATDRFAADVDADLSEARELGIGASRSSSSTAAMGSPAPSPRSSSSRRSRRPGAKVRMRLPEAPRPGNGLRRAPPMWSRRSRQT
jgi:predicted DsbA family dithiol-disulfide isomerase